MSSTPYHCILSYRDQDGREGDRGFIRMVRPGQTRAEVYQQEVQRLADDHFGGVAAFTVLFFSLEPNELGVPGE